MFIFNRPLAAVAAGLATALLVVAADGLCQRGPTVPAAAPAVPTVSAARAPGHTAVTCKAAERCGIVRAGS
jgi:hypothetical protein